MRQLLKDFIKENIDLIDQNKWDAFYKLVDQDYSILFDNDDPAAVCELTEFLLDCGCQLDTLTYIPELFMCRTKRESFNIPENVRTIDWCAFEGSQLTHVTIPARCERVRTWAFAECHELTSVTIQNINVHIAPGAFENDMKLMKITFAGTMAQWKEKIHMIVPEGCLIQCSDGSITYNAAEAKLW